MITNSPLPEPNVVKQLLRYEADTGLFFWKKRPLDFFKTPRDGNAWNARFCGMPALNTDRGDGYMVGFIFRSRVLAHRVAWTIWHGELPWQQIDHIDGDRGNNRIENLRCVSAAENNRNIKRSSRNTSGVTGVYWNPTVGRWQAYITVGGSYKYLGIFDDIRDATLARKAAERTLGFHPNHGR
jgi:hypothetical protein